MLELFYVAILVTSDSQLLSVSDTSPKSMWPGCGEICIGLTVTTLYKASPSTAHLKDVFKGLISNQFYIPLPLVK